MKFVGEGIVFHCVNSLSLHLVILWLFSPFTAAKQLKGRSVSAFKSPQTPKLGVQIKTIWRPPVYSTVDFLVH